MTITEQEYVKQIYLGTNKENGAMHTKELAHMVAARPPSVTNMVKKLAAKGLVSYRKSYGFSLTDKGSKEAVRVIRRHRLWELFLTEKLGINWKEVHLIACQLQGIDIDMLTNNLEAYLGHPVYDPHGEIIPDASGLFPLAERTEIYDLKINEPATVSGFRESSNAFLEYMEKLKLLIGHKVNIISLIEYDLSIEIEVNGIERFIISKETAQKVYVTLNNIR